MFVHGFFPLKRIRLLNVSKRCDSTLTGQWPWLNVFFFFPPLWCAPVIRGAVHMPGVVWGHQRAAVHYKGASAHCITSVWDQLEEGSSSLSLLTLLQQSFSGKMEARVFAVFCIFLVCTFAVVFSSQESKYPSGLQSRLAFRNLSVNPHSRYPLYMMQLYRSFRNADSSSSVAVNTRTASGENLSARTSDSVLSLMARGECTLLYTVIFLCITTLWRLC